MNEFIFSLVTILISALAGALGSVLIARYSKGKQERESGLVSDYIKITDMTGAQLERKINQVDRLEVEIEAIKKARTERDIETQKERDELKARIQADLMETEKLRNEYAKLSNEHEQAQKQIVKLEDLAIKMGEYVDGIITAMKEGKEPPLNGELLESVHRLKLSVEERRKLAGGK
jgi:hypothetical protein